ncbi:MAG: AsmA family protein [Pseudomonadota bacterium]
MKWLLGIFSLIVVVLGGLAFAPSFFDWNQYKEPALKQVADLTGLNVSIGGDVSLALLPSPRVYLENVKLKDPTDTGGEKDMAALEMLDVRVALMPLFQGKAVVNSVHLEKPQILLSKNAEGQFNFMTPKLEALMSAKDAAAAGNAGAPADASFAISFDSISIDDGVFIYREAGQKAPVELTGINVDVSGSSLEGPFNAKGSLAYNGQPVSFDAKTGKIDKALQSTSLNLEAQMAGIAVRYAGVVAGGDAPEIQGETSVSVKSLSELMKKDAPKGLEGGLAVSGLLTANAERASLKNANMRIAGKDLSGAIEASMKPISVKGAFTGEEIIDLDAFKGEPKAKGEVGFDPGSLGTALPQTLELPALGEIALSLTAPGVIVNGQVLKDVQVKVTNTEKSFAGSFEAGSIPGRGRVQAQGALSYAEKSASQKSGTEIYSDPSAAFEIKGQTQNLPQTVQAFSGLSGLPLIEGSKEGLFDIAGSLNSKGLSISKGIINIDDAAFALSGAWEAQSDSPRSMLKAKVVADSLNFDSLTGSGNAPAGGDPLGPLKTLALPYDVDVDVTVNNAVLQGHDIQGLKIAAAILPNSLKINNIGAQSFAGAKLSVKGAINDLNALSGLNINANIDAPDPYKLADALKVDTASWPKDLGATKVNAVASGNIEALDVDVDVGALGGEVGVQGQVSNPMTQLEIGGLAVSLKHPNTAKALRSFAPGAPNYASLAKPLDVKANLQMNGKVTSLTGISGSIAGATTNGDITFDGSGTKPNVKGTLRIGDLVLKSADKGSSGSSGGSSAAQRSASASGGKWSSETMNTGWLHAMNASIDIAANNIVYETWDLKKPALKLSLQNGTMTISDLQAGLYDGQIGMNGTISSANENAPMNVKTAAKIDNINLGTLAKALAGSSRIQATGDVSLDFDVSGQGASQSALVSSLNGAANLNGANVIMRGFDLAGLAGALMESNKPLPRIQEILSSSTRSGETAFEIINGAYAIQNGVVSITNMAMDGPEAAINSTGSVSVPRWSIDTNHKITLKNAPDVAPFDVAIKGPLDNPANTFGSGLFDTFVRQKLQQKAVEKLPDLLGDGATETLQQFGILPRRQQQPPAAETEPASGDAPAANDNAASAQESAQQPQEVKPEDVVNDLLRGFLQ